MVNDWHERHHPGCTRAHRQRRRCWHWRHCRTV